MHSRGLCTDIRPRRDITHRGLAADGPGGFRRGHLLHAGSSTAQLRTAAGRLSPPDNPNDPICGGARAFLRYAYTLRQPLGGRSLVHTDSTYIIARKVGFSVRDAYWIAAYSEATDLGTFVPP